MIEKKDKKYILEKKRINQYFSIFLHYIPRGCFYKPSKIINKSNGEVNIVIFTNCFPKYSNCPYIYIYWKLKKNKLKFSRYFTTITFLLRFSTDNDLWIHLERQNCGGQILISCVILIIIDLSDNRFNFRV